MVKAVLLDFDGTIADTSRPIFEGYKYLFKKYRPDIEINQELLDSFLGPALIQKIPLYFDGDFEKLVQEYREAGNGYISKEYIKIYPGFLELVDELKKRNIKVCLVTSRFESSILATLKALDLNNCFDIISCIDYVTKGKPDREQFDYVLNKLNLKSEEAIMIGDHDNDIKGAINAHIKPVGVSWSSLGEEKLKTLGAEYIIKDSFLEVLNII